MQFKQISAIQVGSKFNIFVYALSEDGNLYVFKTQALSPDKGEWKQVQSMPNG